MDNIIITSAKYNLDDYGNNCSIQVVIDGQELSVPLDPANRHYAEILRQTQAGVLTIQEA